MKKDYLCPSCKGHLKANEKIVFSAATEGGKKGLILLSPQVGDYSMIKHDGFEIKEGEHLDFFCPVCHSNLVAADINENLARVIMKDDSGEYDIIFSIIYGQKCTYKVQNDNVEAFGENSDEYMNFFGEIPKY